jgi:glycosyltransferase involved in cell wall biosynthesis
MFWSSMFASPIAWACRVPVVIETLHGTEAWRSGWKANCIIDRATTPFLSRYVAVCQSDARFLESRKRVAPSKIRVIPNGIEVSRFAVSESTRTAARQKLGFEEKDRVLIVIARFHWGKGHRVLLDAMPQLLRSYPTLKLVFLGEGAEAAELRARSEVLGITDCVQMPGYKKNVEDWLAAADINVLPTLYEGLPLTILEAMAAALPTVASNVGGIPDAIEDGVTGILVPPGDSNRLAAGISSLLEDRDLRLRLAKAAHDRVVGHFTLEEQILRTQNVYLDLCRGVEGVNRSSSSDSRSLAPSFPFISVSGDEPKVGSYRSEHP